MHRTGKYGGKLDLARQPADVVESLHLAQLGNLLEAQLELAARDELAHQHARRRLPGLGFQLLGESHALEKIGVDTRVQSAIPMATVSEPYIRRRAVRHMEKGRVVIFAAGTGNPFFTTDTAASLRAIEIGADLLLKATKVNGVYSDDPVKNPAATRFDSLSYDRVLDDRLNVMDAAAIVLCRDNDIPLRVFNLHNPGDLPRVLRGENVGTLVSN